MILKSFCITSVLNILISVSGFQSVDVIWGNKTNLNPGPWLLSVRSSNLNLRYLHKGSFIKWNLWNARTPAGMVTWGFKSWPNLSHSILQKSFGLRRLVYKSKCCIYIWIPLRFTRNYISIQFSCDYFFVVSMHITAK